MTKGNYYYDYWGMLMCSGMRDRHEIGREVVMRSWGFLLFYTAYDYTVIIDMGRK